MTALLERPAPRTPHAPASEPAYLARYRRQSARRRLAADALVVAGWLVVAIPVALWLAGGGWAAMASSGAGVVRGLGILAGLVATASMVVMLWLSARVPFIDATIGHDRALALHSELGQLTFTGLVLHGLFLVTGYALADGMGWFAEWAVLWSNGDFVLAVIAIALLTAVAISSVVAARRRLPHEVWQGIHLLTYAAVLAALPHQFTLGGLFASGVAQWFWVGLWSATFFMMLTYRVFLPVAVSLEHRLVVRRVVWETRDTVSIEVTGRRLGALGARAGQFFHWRFLQGELWWTQHPFSISSPPHGDTMRITVRALGEGTRRLIRALRPGTAVFVEGPYGLFSDAARTSRGVVLIGVGIGVAPIRALLEDTEFEPGRCTVILRARSADELALLGEVEQWCRARGARLVVLTGRRGVHPDGSASWLPQSEVGHRLTDLAGGLADADVYVCGPPAAADLIVADAAACGVPPHRLHRERFSW